MTVAQAPSASIATGMSPAEADDVGAGTLTDRLVSDLGDDFDLSPDPDDPTPAEARVTDLEADDFDEAEDDEGAEDTKPETPAKKKPTPQAPKPKDEAAKEEPAPQPKAAKPVLPADRGTEDKPYSINDLPADKFVKVKIDGQERTIPLREAADGYIRKQTMDAHVGKAQQLVADAQRIGKAAVERHKQTVANVNQLLGNAEHLFNYISQDVDLMTALGKKMGDRFLEWEKDPGSLQRYREDLQQRAIQAERERLDRERSEWEQSRTQKEAAERNNALWMPVWREALKEAGFPKVTPELRNYVTALVQVTQNQNGGKLTAEQFKACVKQAAKLAGSETVADRQPEPSAAPAARAPRPNGSNGKTKWDGMPHAVKMRDPNYLLRR